MWVFVAVEQTVVRSTEQLYVYSRDPSQYTEIPGITFFMGVKYLPLV